MDWGVEQRWWFLVRVKARVGTTVEAAECRIWAVQVWYTNGPAG